MEFSPKVCGTGTTGLNATLAESLVPEKVPWPAGCEGRMGSLAGQRGLSGQEGGGGPWVGSGG